MAPNRASSPTGMLWAHQLKREHGFLLDRMKKLETAIGKVESTAKSAKIASASHDIGSIAQQVKALTQDGGSKATEKIRKEVMERLESVDTDLEAITVKVVKLDENFAKIEEERKRAFSNEKALVKRVKDVEHNLNEYEKNLSRLGEQINQRQVDVIREQLANLLDQVKEEGAERESFKKSLKVLEQITSALKGDNKKLAREIKDLGKRPALLPASVSPPLARRQPGAKFDTGALPMTEADDEESPMPERLPRFTTKTIKPTKPNKKGRGMACSDCRKARIRCEHDVPVHDAAEEEDIPGSSGPKQATAANVRTVAPQPSTKNAAPQAAPAQTARTARMTKKEVAEANESNPQAKAPPKRGLQRELQRLKAASQFIKKEPATQRASQRQVVDSGRGWVTFEHTPSDEEGVVPQQSSQDSSKGFTAAERVKRGRGRPRKIAPDTPPKPVVSKRARGRPRKDSPQLTTQVAAPKRPRGRPRKDSSQAQAQKQAQPDTPKRGPGRPRKHINQFPTATGTKNPTPTPAPAPAPRRRQIKPEPSDLRAQPLREAKAVPTTEHSSPIQPPTKNPTVIKQEPGREKKNQSALEALKKRRSDPYAVPTSSPLSSPPVSTPVRKAQGKRKAVEELPAPRTVKRGTLEKSGD